MNLIKGFVRFNQGLLRMPWAIKLFVLWLIVVNAVMSSYFLPQIEAMVVFISFMLSALVMMILTATKGFTRILGLAHFIWLPSLIFLLSRLPQVNFDTRFGQWIVMLLVSNTIALIFDVNDVRRYLSGERAEMDV